VKKEHETSTGHLKDLIKQNAQQVTHKFELLDNPSSKTSHSDSSLTKRLASLEDLLEV
jgi:hypothetical protein